MFCSSSKKVVVCFTIISNLAVTTRVSVNNVRADLFLKGIFITEQQTQFTRLLEITLRLHNFKLFYIELTKPVLSCCEFFPIKGRMQISSFFEAFSTTSLFIKTLS